MKPGEIRELLGGYASGTLTEAEKKLLFNAALDDQVLFDAMADEQALKDLLDDPESRGYLEAVLDESTADGPTDERDSALMAPAPAASRAVFPEAPAGSGVKPAPPPRSATRHSKVLWSGLAAAALATVSVVGILRFTQPIAPAEVAKNSEPQPPSTPTLGVAQPSKREPTAVPTPKSAKRVMPDVRPVSPAPVVTPQLKTPESTIAGPPKQSEPTQSDARRERGEVIPLAPPPQPASSATQDQLEQTKTQTPAVGARQLYLGEDRAQASNSGTAVPAPEIPVSSAKRKAAAPAAPGGAVSSRASALAAPAKPGFGMRYRILRKTGENYQTVLPGAPFHVGEQLVIVIEKNSGGTATIDRIGGNAATSIPLAVQSNELARSEPFTVTGPMELALILNRNPGDTQRMPEKPAATQKSEVADGMVYVAEPTSAAAQGLVVRVSIRVE